MKLLNTLLQIALRMLVMLFVFQICRLLFLLVNKGFYPEIDVWSIMRLMAGGLKYDIAAILLINLPYFILILLPLKGGMEVVFQRFSKVVFIIFNLGAIIAIAIDIFYFPYTMERLSVNFLHYMGTQKNLGILLWNFLGDYWYAVFVFAAFIALIIRGYNRIGKIELPSLTPVLHKVTVITTIGTLCLGVVGTASNWIPNKSMLTTDDAWRHASNPFEVAAVINTPYNILFSAIAVTNTVQFPQLELKKYETDSVSAFKKMNVVIFILESFSRESSGLLNPNLANGNYKGYTPFIDSLMQHGYYFTHAYANGRRSIDAVPAILSSVPAIQLKSDDSTLVSIASLLKREGYTTQFFHGAHNGSMDFDKFCENAGIVEYYGLTEFNNNSEFDGTWGIWDEPFLQYMAQQQLKSQEPFCSTVFNLTSHNPYVLPDLYEGKFEEGIDPICRCIEYSDYSIRKYFETVSKMTWFENAIFIFTTDHSIIPWHKEYATTEKAFAIPLFFYTPNKALTGKSDRIAQHVDILPTLLTYLNYPHPFSSIGNDLLDENAGEWAITEIVRIPQLIEKGGRIRWLRPNDVIMQPEK